MSKIKEILENPLTGYLLEKLALPLLNTLADKQNKDKQTTTATPPKGEAMPPKHFTLSEFQCKHCGQLPAQGMNPVLLAKLDQLRERLGAPIYITSGYRCPTHNKAVGGVSNSQHVFGKAADIYTDALTVEQLAALCKEIGFDGIGTYLKDDFVHVDVRDNGNSPARYVW